MYFIVLRSLLKSKKRKYDASYVLFGPTCINERDETLFFLRKNSCEQKFEDSKTEGTSVYDTDFFRAKKGHFKSTSKTCIYSLTKAFF